jgi:hypothetical protein
MLPRMLLPPRLRQSRVLPLPRMQRPLHHWPPVLLS